MDNEETRPLATDKTAKKSLGEMLVEEKLITQEQLEGVLAQQQRLGGKLSDILINQGLVKAEVLATVLSIHLNLPLIDLKRHMVQPQALPLIPEEMARKNCLIPIGQQFIHGIDFTYYRVQPKLHAQRGDIVDLTLYNHLG